MQKRFVPIVIFCLALVLVVLATLCGRNMATPVFGFAQEAREVYLTFDDGPSTVVTGRILDTLKEEGVKATFFVVGERIYGREETLKRIAGEGHVLGVHSYSHCYGEIYSSNEAFLEDVKKCANVIERVTGVKPRLYRFPGGGKHEDFATLLRDMGYEIVWWNAVCGDTEIADADTETLAATAIQTAGGKAKVVLLMHDSAPHKATAEALPKIISHFKQEGYTFKTL